MASLISTCVKPPSPDDYCVDLRASQSLLISGFNSSNTIQVYSLPSLQLSSIYSTNSLGVLSEIAQYEENSVFWADRRGNIGLVDLRTMTPAHSLSTNEEIFSIDSSGYNLAVASDKRITIYDIRNFQEKKRYEDLYADDNDITSVRLSKDQENLLISCSEDSLMAICNVDSNDEDDYTLLNVEEPALKVGFCGLEVYCITINRLVSYDTHLGNIEMPPEVMHKHKLSEYQISNPPVGYFISAHNTTENVILAGSHE